MYNKHISIEQLYKCSYKLMRTLTSLPLTDYIFNDFLDM